jgi:transcriptional regulator with XRE-family HTH domain
VVQDHYVTATVQLETLLRDAPLPFIAARVRRARKSLGLSHDRLGSACGMYRANLIKLEQGQHRPRLSTLTRIAKATGRDPRWFVDPEVDPSPFCDADGTEA